MKNIEKSKSFSLLIGAALCALQLAATPAAAEYKGFWADVVHEHQAAHAATAYQMMLPATPSSEEQHYPVEPVFQPEPVYPSEPVEPVRQQQSNMSTWLQHGQASYYAHKYHGRQTASGETYNMYALTAAHPDLPFGTALRVTNLHNGRSVVVRVNDRGPFKPGRIVDLSLAAAEQIGLVVSGVTDVNVEVLG